MEAAAMERHEGDLRTCSMCGRVAVVMSRAPLTMDDEGREYAVQPDFEYEHCTACGEDLVDGRDLDGLFIAATDKVREDRNLLSSDEIRQLRFDLDLTQSALEALLGVGAKSVTRWERGTIVQPQTADTLMRILAAHPELLAEVGAHVAPGGAMVARESRGPYRKSAKRRDAS
jgi:HTH-type transcriptional regulator/antitoxin MqsA